MLVTHHLSWALISVSLVGATCLPLLCARLYVFRGQLFSHVSNRNRLNQPCRPPTQVTFDGVLNAAECTGIVRTLSHARQTLRVVCAACHKLGKEGTTDMYDKLLTQWVLPGKVDVMVHHGDQVYADDAFDEGVQILRSSIPEADKDAAIVECYKRIYRRTWTQPSMKALLAQASHLMMWDDHESRNDWGTFTTDWDPRSIDWRIVLCARTAYWQYQRQLWDDIDNWPNRLTDPECHFHVYGPFGLLILDSRGCRSFGRDLATDINKFMGQRQMTDLKRVLDVNDGMFRDAKAIVVVMTVPPVYFSANVSRVLKIIPPLEDKMGFGSYPVEQAEFLDVLWAWRRPRDRERLDESQPPPSRQLFASFFSLLLHCFQNSHSSRHKCHSRCQREAYPCVQHFPRHQKTSVCSFHRLTLRHLHVHISKPRLTQRIHLSMMFLQITHRWGFALWNDLPHHPSGEHSRIRPPAHSNGLLGHLQQPAAVLCLLVLSVRLSSVIQEFVGSSGICFLLHYFFHSFILPSFSLSLSLSLSLCPP